MQPCDGLLLTVLHVFGSFVKEKSENEFFARAVGESVFVIATSRKDLRRQVKEKLKEQFYPQLIPAKVRFRFYKDEVLKLDFN